MRIIRKTLIITAVLVVFFFSNAVHAADHEVRFVSVSWTGVTIKSELGVKILNSLGYKASNLMVSVPIVYQALDTGEADVFLGNWMPSMKTIAEKYFNKGSVVKYTANMPNAKYTLAVPTYVAEAGLTSFADIAKFGERLDHRIYGIEEGNDGNEIIQSMIDQNMFGLKSIELIPSSEQGMLLQVQSYANEKKWIVFLGWAPHYMNETIDMTYLDGSTDQTFGGDNGTATVYTNTRKGFVKENPNVGRFLKNYTFPIYMINQIMKSMHKDSSLRADQAALAWVKKHPEIYTAWLDGVTTTDGKPGIAAFEAFLKTVK